MGLRGPIGDLPSLPVQPAASPSRTPTLSTLHWPLSVPHLQLTRGQVRSVRIKPRGALCCLGEASAPDQHATIICFFHPHYHPPPSLLRFDQLNVHSRLPFPPSLPPSHPFPQVQLPRLTEPTPANQHILLSLANPPPSFSPFLPSPRSNRCLYKLPK